MNSRQYEFADITVIFGGKDITKLRNISYKKTADREAVFGKGRYAHSIQTGNISVEGSVTMLQSDVIDIEEATGRDILSASVDIEVSYAANGVLRTDRVIGARISEYEKSMAQGDKFMEIELPFLALDVNEGV